MEGQQLTFTPAQLQERTLHRRATEAAIWGSRYLSQDERIEIADLRQSGLSLRAIAARLDRAPSTISRELGRNAAAGRGYRPFDAHRRATGRRARPHRRRVETIDLLGGVVAELLLRRWSPQQISRHRIGRWRSGGFQPS